MRANWSCVFAVVLLALLPGLAACGGSGHRQSAAARQQAAKRWRAGLLHWHHEMLGALDGISLLFSTTVSLAGLAHEHSHVTIELKGFEQTLTGCTAAVAKLGPGPIEFSDARRYAVRACKNLELGERLVEAAVTAMRHGAGVDLSGAAGPLSDGQNEMAVAVAVLRSATIT